MTENPTSNIVELTLDNAQEIIKQSSELLVVIDFWIDNCEPCKILLPIMEKLAQQYQDQLILAKVNANDQQMLTAQFGVGSFPTVMLIKDNKPIDGFMGAQTEGQVRALLKKYLPDPWESSVQQARELQEQGDHQQALPLLRQAYADSEQQIDIAKALALSLIELNRCDEAQQLLDIIKAVDTGAEYQHLVSMLELKDSAALSPELDILEKKWQQQPDNYDICCELAIKLSEQGRHKQSLDMLMESLRSDINAGEGQVKKTLLDILNAMGKGDPLATSYQRQLFTLLH